MLEILNFADIISLILIISTPFLYLKNRKLNKKPKVSKLIDYPPTDNSYSIINGICFNDKKNRTGEVNVRGFSIEIAKLIINNVIGVKINDADNPYEKIILIINSKTKGLSINDKRIIKILRLFKKQELNLKHIDESLNDKKTLKLIKNELTEWRFGVESANEIKSYEYYKLINYFELIIIIIYLILALPLQVIQISHGITSDIALIILSLICILTTAKNKHVMGHYTDKGYEFITKWFMFEEYLKRNDRISLDSNEVLLYASCFEIEDMILKKIDKKGNSLELFIRHDGVKLLGDILYKHIPNIPSSEKSKKYEDSGEIIDYGQYQGYNTAPFGGGSSGESGGGSSGGGGGGAF